MLAPVQAINLRKNQNLLPALAYMSHQHAGKIRNVRKEQDVCSWEPWMKTRNDCDYLHPVYRKSGLFVRRTGRALYEYQCAQKEIQLAVVDYCSCSAPVILCGASLRFVSMDTLATTQRLFIATTASL